MKNFETMKDQGMKVLANHPRIDLHASELRALREAYDGRDVLEAITDLWLIGLAAGYKAGLADGKEWNRDN